MAAIKCIACKGKHSTISEVKECHTKRGALIGDAQPTKTVKAVQAPKEKGYQLFTFTTKEERDAFIKANPLASVATTTTRWVANPAGGSMQETAFKAILRK